MKNIDFKNPRYVLPLICLPFILLLFYVYRISLVNLPPSKDEKEKLKSEISPASLEVSGRAIEDKLEAFKQRYKKSDGYTAMSSLDMASGSAEDISSAYNAKEKLMLDSINQALRNARKNNPKEKSFEKRPSALLRNDPSIGNSEQDRSIKDLFLQYNAQNKVDKLKQTDPMAIFRAQMAIVDSMNKAAMPPRLSPVNSRPALGGHFSKQMSQPLLRVAEVSKIRPDDSTILAEEDEGEFIQAIIDESLRGYSGSRVSIRLLTEVKAGTHILPKGTRLYALISGFSIQRVMLSISSIAIKGEILPVNLEVYDLDGLKGMYIPASLYREFSRDLLSSGLGGVSIESTTGQNQQLVSLMGRVFQSTQGAVNKLIRSNKVTINYPSRVFLLDNSSNKPNTSL